MMDSTSKTTQNSSTFRNIATVKQTKEKLSTAFREQFSRSAANPVPVQSTSRDRTSPPTQQIATASPVDVLKSKLAELGISSAGLTFTEQRWTINNPGRSWENHCVTVDFGNGVKENYDVDLMMQNPQVSAVEVAYTRRLLGLA